MSEIEIIRGGTADLPAIMPVMASAFGTEFGEAWTESQCLGVVSMPGSHLVIARHDSAVGFALSRVIIDECELMLLAVNAESQRAGIGRDLLDAIIADYYCSVEKGEAPVQVQFIPQYPDFQQEHCLSLKPFSCGSGVPG